MVQPEPVDEAAHRLLHDVGGQIVCPIPDANTASAALTAAGQSVTGSTQLQSVRRKEILLYRLHGN